MLQRLPGRVASSRLFTAGCGLQGPACGAAPGLRAPAAGLTSLGASSWRASSAYGGDIQTLPSVKKKITGRFGVEWLSGRKPTEIYVQMVDLPRLPYNPKPYKLDFRRYIGVASGLGAEYYFREGQRHPLSYFHLRGPMVGGDLVAVGATDERAREARTISNFVQERTRGFAVQLILEGRGVKAYFDPQFPSLKARLGVGAKVTDLTDYCKRDPDCKVSCNKKGDILCVHGPNKERVGTLAYRLLKRLQPKLQAYTGKGAHFAFHPERRKPIRKK